VASGERLLGTTRSTSIGNFGDFCSERKGATLRGRPLQASTGSAGLVDGVVATLGEPVADIVVTHGVRERSRAARQRSSKSCLLA
jgi:hypothetical protein